MIWPLCFCDQRRLHTVVLAKARTHKPQEVLAALDGATSLLTNAGRWLSRRAQALARRSRICASLRLSGTTPEFYAAAAFFGAKRP